MYQTVAWKQITRAVSDCSSVMCATTKRPWVTIPTSGTCVGCMSRAMLCVTGRVDFTSLLCCNQTHFAFSVGHEFINPSFESVLWKLKCFRHAVVSVCDVCLLPETSVDST